MWVRVPPGVFSTMTFTTRTKTGKTLYWSGYEILPIRVNVKPVVAFSNEKPLLPLLIKENEKKI